VTEPLAAWDGRLTRIAFVTEGGSTVGLGHVTRCAALARVVAGGGASVSFVVPPDPQVLALLRQQWSDVAPVPWTTDPAAALNTLRLREADVVVVDGYSTGPEFLRALRSVAGQVVAVDDAADRELPVDVVVNGGVSAERLPYRRTRDTVFLLGPSYALLDPAYAELPDSSSGERVRRTLVCLGVTATRSSRCSGAWTLRSATARWTSRQAHSVMTGPSSTPRPRAPDIG
jgi:spore coat polysaccharide biosynthesis predicted glycosyltransferase SpsG